MTDPLDTASLFSVIHGESGVGKSWLSYSSPKPMLILDSEFRTKFIPKSRKVLWNPRTERPPAADVFDPADPQGRHFCVAYVREYRDFTAAYQWLAAGDHPFVSVSVDSVTEMQKRVIDDTSGTAQPDQADWGAILRHMEDTVRKFRDLGVHPTAPLQAVTLICLTHFRDDKFRPFVKGQLELSLPGFADLVGYLYAEANPESGEQVRKLLIQPFEKFLAKDGTDVLSRHYGPVVARPNITDMLTVMNNA